MDENPIDLKVYDEHAKLVGRVTMAWAEIHAVLYRIFWGVSGLEREMAEAIFFSLKSDSAQRDLVIAALSERFKAEEDKEVRKSATELIGQVNNYSNQRNAAAHSMWAILHPPTTIIPDPHISKQRNLKEDFVLQFTDLEKNLRTLFTKLFAFDQTLNDFVARAAERLPQQTKSRHI
ncbi:MAG TPA: hypothetical protein PL193_10205 [Xanthobacteraceae bacterium]|nr:hypothetical protein [Xanthobacteraceae bacterium]